MDLIRLRTLRELSLRRTMAAVAEALLISPSAVSQQIAQLEDETGIELIERRGRGVRLTPAGETLVAHADRIVSILEEAKTDLAEMRSMVAGELRVTAFSSVAATLIPPAMRRISEMHPHLDVVLEVLEPLEGLAALRAWQADVAIIDDFTVDLSSVGETIEWAHLFDDRLLAMLPSHHPLVSREFLSLEDLRHDRWALDVASHAYTDRIVAACEAAGFRPRTNGYCDGFEVVVGLVQAGCSVSAMPGLRIESVPGSYAVRPIEPPIKRGIYVSHRRGERRNPTIAAVVNALFGAVLERRRPVSGD